MAQYTSTKSQILSVETMLMIVFFIAFAGTFYQVFNSRNSSVSSFREANELEKTVIEISELLVKTAGYPADWNQSTVLQPGFVQGDACSYEKAEMFFNISESGIRSLLGLGNYSIFINLTSIYNYTEQLNFSAGIYPSNQEVASPISRFFLIEKNGTRIPAKIEVVVWR